MAMVPLDELLPDVARRETRAVEIMDEGKSTEEVPIPAGRFAFLESYCNEPGCDCRRVFLNVVREEPPEIMATISFGWEKAKFYRKWMGGTGRDVKELTGPILAALCPQSKHAPLFLRLFQDVVLKPDYVDRIRRHYEMFKQVMDERTREEAPNEPAQATHASVGRNDPCPCGSGRKYKKCCGA